MLYNGSVYSCSMCKLLVCHMADIVVYFLLDPLRCDHATNLGISCHVTLNNPIAVSVVICEQ